MESGEMREKVSILLVDDSEDDYILMRDLLDEMQGIPYALEWSTTCRGVADRIKGRHYDVCLFDYRLGERNGVELLQEVKSVPESPPVILLTWQGDRRTDFEAMQAGRRTFW